MQARGTTEKTYAEQCKVGGTMPAAAPPEPRPTAAAPAPAPSQAAPTETQAAPEPAPRRSTPTTTAAPTRRPSAPKSTATLEAGQFADDVSAKASCPTDTIVWVNKDFFPHTATAQDRSFDSKNIGTDKTWRYVASKDGTFAYICTRHPAIKPTPIVK